MQFSSDFRYICGGSVSMHREATSMDGRWTVCWDGGETALIEIVAGEWTLMGSEYRLDLTSEDGPCFSWPNEALDQTVKQVSSQAILHLLVIDGPILSTRLLVILAQGILQVLVTYGSISKKLLVIQRLTGNYANLG